MSTESTPLPRFRLRATADVSVEFSAASPLALMDEAHRLREQLGKFDYVILQVWANGAWHDPTYYGLAREYVVRRHAYPYLAGWRDLWRWFGLAE